MGNNFTQLRNNSVFNPHIVNNKYVDLFKKLVTTDLEQLPIKKVYEQKDIRKGLKSLESRKDIVIRQADKGRGIVVLSLEQYKIEMDRILEDRSTYQILKSDPSKCFKKELKSIIHYGTERGLLSKKKKSIWSPLSVELQLSTIFQKFTRIRTTPQADQL